MINSMNESNNNSQPIGSSPAINSVTQDETQDEVESGSKKRKERRIMRFIYVPYKSTSEIEKLKELIYTLFQEYESSDPGARNITESVGGSSFSGSGSSASHRVEFKKLLSNIASITNQHDDLDTCSDETEAYCRTIEYDYDVEEESKESEVIG
ncbi:hypothetical protein L6452_26051 [Arctium lappa]|uniref:Uncharacterized protein n=1 Tax=Arctium lappa TaxID=4217 RepID=A0ACB9AB99_ARCLA|nr:hypothetical protein L6452_26051 [Arctium lappa]